MNEDLTSASAPDQDLNVSEDAKIVAYRRWYQDVLKGLERLVNVAQGDGRDSELAADFILGWLAPHRCGAFNVLAIGPDRIRSPSVVEDIILVATMAERTGLGARDYTAYTHQMEAILRRWRPLLADDERFMETYFYSVRESWDYISAELWKEKIRNLPLTGC